jgi:soluble lytic murein transglycosylase-like protein
MTGWARQDGQASGDMVIAVAVAGLLLAIPLIFGGAGSSMSAGGQTCTPGSAAGQPQPSQAAISGIPHAYLTLFLHAGQRYGIPWNILAGIGRTESDFGANDGPSSAGALGPMQFLPSTWAIYGNSGNIMNPAAAIPAAARYLLAHGAPGNIPAAIFAYCADVLVMLIWAWVPLRSPGPGAGWVGITPGAGIW